MTDCKYNCFKNQYHCVYDDEDDDFLVSWKDEDAELIYTENSDRKQIVDMNNECTKNYSDKNNMFWIDDVKKQYNWKLGDCIYLNTKQTADNYFYVRKAYIQKCFDVAIDEDGYVIKRYYQHYGAITKNISYDFVARPTCVYNDYYTKYAPTAKINKNCKMTSQDTVRYPNRDKKNPCDVVHLDLINTKFQNYKKGYRHHWLDSGTPFNYLMNMWRDLDFNCNFWVWLLEHYRFHIHGHYNYFKFKEQRALDKIKRILF